MYANIRPFLELCVMARGPQDLPASPSWLVIAAAGYFAVGAAIAWPLYPPGLALLSAGVDVALLFGIAAGLLAWRGYTVRWLQTALALAGSGFLMGVVALPIVFSLYRAILTGSEATFSALAYWVLVGWIIAIYGYIFTQALSLKSRWSGLGVALGYFVVSWIVMQLLFPQGQLASGQ
ncbi:MAG TPA: hypothetical protein ENN42_09015 [Thioalkalivibrio sp.]|nr:hypothetical protein [Thioalkalivibrio sp.]